MALELLLTDDADEAERLAAELEDLNRERQAVEERILREAVALVESWSPAERQRRGYVLWDETWHEGVNGIVASRLVERYNRPVVLIARSATGWKGSGRSISTFDLHGALGACAEPSRALRRAPRRRRAVDRRRSSWSRSARRSRRTPTPS